MSWRRRTAIGVLLAVGSLAGCTATDPGHGSDVGGPRAAPPVDVDRPPGATPVVAHPSGDPGRWLDPGYAAGIGDPRTFAGIPCQVAGGVLAATTPDGIVGYDLASGDEVWRARGTCMDEPAADALYLDRRGDGQEREIFRIDVATGEEGVLITIDEPSLMIDWVGHSDQAEYFYRETSDGAYVFAVAHDGPLLWTAEVAPFSDCRPYGDHIVCTDLDGFTVLDRGSGTTTIPPTEIEDDQWMIWASDGYSFDADIYDVRAIFYDYTGTEIATISDPWLWLRPTDYQGVVYSVEDLDRSGDDTKPVLVDSEGRLVVSVTGTTYTLAASGVTVDYTFNWLAAGADGSTALGMDGHGVTLFGSDGSRLAERDDVPAERFVVMGGMLVTWWLDDSGDWVTEVFLPADDVE